jgi:hypothetical protein
MTQSVAVGPHGGGVPEDKKVLPRRRRRPTAGFVTVCLVYAALAVFFAWGMSTPDLDRVWTLHHQLKSGRGGGPRAPDPRLLGRSMVRHPELAGALLRDASIGLISSNSEGWIATSEATILRTKRSQAGAVQLEIASPDALLPIQVELEGQNWRESKQLTARGVHAIALPALSGTSELIVLRLKGRAAHADPSVLGVRVSFSDAASDRARAGS